MFIASELLNLLAFGAVLAVSCFLLAALLIALARCCEP